MKNYGADHPLKNKDIKDKVNKTCLEKYGVEHYAQTKIAAECRRCRYLYDDIYFDSSWELYVWIYCTENNIPIIHNPVRLEYIVDNITHSYFPDFEIDGKLVEIKGNQFLDKDNNLINPYKEELNELYKAKGLCAKENHVDLSTKENILNMIDYVENKYTKNYIKLFKIDLEFPFLNSDFSDRSDYGIIRHFHKSIYHANRQGFISPYEAWTNKNLVKKSALNRLKYVGSCRPQDIVQGFNVAKIAPKVSVFDPKLAIEILNKYAKEYDTIIDPFSGFSGRMIGSYRLGKKYIGFDINQEHVAESNEIINFLNASEQLNVSINDIKTCTRQDSEVLFTCPPYSNKEIWNENEDIKTCDEWIDICLEKFECKKYIFVVDETLKYKNYILEKIDNRSHLGENSEYIIVIEKE